MLIAEHIRNVIESRLREKQVVVLYDAENRYHEIAAAIASVDFCLIDTSAAIVQSREAAVTALINRGGSPEKSPYVLIYVPGDPPADDDTKCGDFFSALAEAGDSFPKGDSDDYLELCLQAKPDYGTKVRKLFSNGIPSFEAVDAIGDGGGNFPQLKTELGCVSNAEILITLLVPKEGHASLLKNGGICRKEAIGYLNNVLAFAPKKTNASWALVQDELWRFVLFSEFKFDLPEDLPNSLSTVSVAPDETLDLVNRVCADLRDGKRTRPTYIEQSERVAEELDLENAMASFRDLGLRDTFSFEERSFLTGYIDAVRATDYPTAESIAEGRRESIWVQESDRQLLWTFAERALDLLRGINDFERELNDVKTDTSDLIGFYVSRGYRLDQRYRYFEETLTEIDEYSEDLDLLVASCREGYRKCVDRMQRMFITGVKASGWPATGTPAACSLFNGHIKPLLMEKDAKVAVLWIDALRYELAVALNDSISVSHKTELSAICSSLPSITQVGMASLLPDASTQLSLKIKAGKLVPTMGDKATDSAKDRVAVLAAEYGDRFLDVPMDDLVKKRLTKAYRERFDNKGLVLVRYHHIDRHGEGHAPDLFQMLKSHTDKILKAVNRLADLGFTDIFIQTDHGFLVFPEKIHGNKAAKPSGAPWALDKERVLAGSAGEHPDTVRFNAADLGVKGDIEHLVFPKTLATFTEGVLYYHGGLSIQECLIPSLHILGEKAKSEGNAVWELQLRYRGKSTGTVTTRRPMIEVAAFSDNIFQQDITFNLIAINESDELIGTAASGTYTDKNTGYVTIRTGQTAKIPLKLSESFNGSFKVYAQDPETNKYLGDPIKLQTQILE